MKKGIDFTGISVTFACHDGAGNFLLAKRSAQTRDEQGTWDLGGGGLELGDLIEDTLRKEVKEEYCADILDFEQLGMREVHREKDGVKSHWIAFDFKVLLDPAQVQNGEPHKIDELGWFSLHNLPSPLHSQLPFYFEKYTTKLREPYIKESGTIE
jgi:ADP-ribose pyrophosphatase YjhB (NUDIX family)